MRTKLPVSEYEAKVVQCWSYDRKKNETGRKRITCPYHAKACETRWQSVDETVREITYQGCFQLDSFLINDKMLNCSTEQCKGLHQCQMPSEDTGTSRGKTAHYANFCCCTSAFCNSDLLPYDGPKSMCPSSQRQQQEAQVGQVESLAGPPLHQDTSRMTDSPTAPFIICGLVAVALIAVGTFIYGKVRNSSMDRSSSFSSHLQQNRSRKYLRGDTKGNKMKCNSDNQIQYVSSEEYSDKTSQSTISDDSRENCNAAVDLGRLIGKGKFGFVYAVANPDHAEEICYKVASGERFMDNCDNESKILQILSPFNHRNIIKFYGIATANVGRGYLMEYCTKGSLRRYLIDNLVDFDVCLSILRDLSSAIAFLHTDMNVPHKPSLAHRDISSGNMLLRSDMTLVVTDFGSAKLLNDPPASGHSDTCASVAAEGTPFYIAPEILSLSINLTDLSASLKQADVYSMSLVMWETVNRCKAFYRHAEEVPPHALPYQTDVATSCDLMDFVAEGKRPRFSFLDQPKQEFDPATGACFMANVSGKIVKTIVECWDKDEDSRLTAACVSDRFQRLTHEQLTFGEMSMNESEV